MSERSSTTEQYVKRIYSLQQQDPGKVVPTGAIATAMGVTPGTATTMIKQLDKHKYVDYHPRKGVLLTKLGTRLALTMIRKHRLLELFMEKTLAIDWAEIHEEADVLEHAVSDKLIDKIDAFLGFPETDPHGDPIPNHNAPAEIEDILLLSQCTECSSVTVDRILNQSPDFLTYISEQGLRPGTVLHIVHNDSRADAIICHAGETQIMLGSNAARKIGVKPHG